MDETSRHGPRVLFVSVSVVPGTWVVQVSVHPIPPREVTFHWGSLLPWVERLVLLRSLDFKTEDQFWPHLEVISSFLSGSELKYRTETSKIQYIGNYFNTLERWVDGDCERPRPDLTFPSVTMVSDPPWWGDHVRPVGDGGSVGIGGLTFVVRTWTFPWSGNFRSKFKSY